MTKHRLNDQADPNTSPADRGGEFVGVVRLAAVETRQAIADKVFDNVHGFFKDGRSLPSAIQYTCQSRRQA